MAFLEVRNVRIAGMSAGVPKRIVNNLEQFNDYSKEYDAAEFVEETGVLERRVDNIPTSDLCVPAAIKLMQDIGWDKDEVEAILFVSQNADYILPATACIIQERLGLKKECYAMDISMGCSGWVYGLSTAASLMQNGTIRKALLMCGDGKRRSEYDGPLFGFAGTVTALAYDEGCGSMKFHLGTDGSSYDAIIIPDGGARNQVTPRSFELEEVNGKMIHRMATRMKGMDVFAFGISIVPKSIRKLTERFQLDYQSCDYYVFHQANMKMNDLIMKKLNLPVEKVPSCMYHFGNTSSASIPLTIVTQLGGKCQGHKSFLCCGFGVGLSWGTVAFDTNDLVLSELVEVEEDKETKWV
jgi:3-oxoacyl-[acyl-carrier-protein] synthase-3